MTLPHYHSLPPYVPFLQALDIELLHEIPIRVMRAADIQYYAPPDVPMPRVQLELPYNRSMRTVLEVRERRRQGGREGGRGEGKGGRLQRRTGTHFFASPLSPPSLPPSLPPPPLALSGSRAWTDFASSMGTWAGLSGCVFRMIGVMCRRFMGKEGNALPPSIPPSLSFFFHNTNANNHIYTREGGREKGGRDGGRK